MLFSYLRLGRDNIHTEGLGSHQRRWMIHGDTLPFQAHTLRRTSDDGVKGTRWDPTHHAHLSLSVCLSQSLSRETPSIPTLSIPSDSSFPFAKNKKKKKKGWFFLLSASHGWNGTEGTRDERLGYVSNRATFEVRSDAHEDPEASSRRKEEEDGDVRDSDSDPFAVFLDLETTWDVTTSLSETGLVPFVDAYDRQNHETTLVIVSKASFHVFGIEVSIPSRDHEKDTVSEHAEFRERSFASTRPSQEIAWERDVRVAVSSLVHAHALDRTILSILRPPS